RGPALLPDCPVFPPARPPSWTPERRNERPGIPPCSTTSVQIFIYWLGSSATVSQQLRVESESFTTLP
ncbi:unnamed protein product, partial [Amoebophrya sp. A120]